MKSLSDGCHGAGGVDDPQILKVIASLSWMRSRATNCFP